VYVTFRFFPIASVISVQLEHTVDLFPYNGINAGHAKPVWLPLSPAAARFARAHEKPYPDPSISVWRCNHCAHHFEKQVLQADAIDHVKKVYVGFLFSHRLVCPTSTELGFEVTASEFQ
jgi:hypothetical protein